ncbi:MAG TPA: hypothetical protein VMM18_16560 [Gemmatimonadaceae bacterium]|nr:hypothetical protein [Gemmatimonadaceae bacterium]
MRLAPHSTPRLRWTVVLVAPLLLSCDSMPPVGPPAAAESRAESRASSVGIGDLADAALFVGNLVPGVPAGNGVFRFDGNGQLIDHVTQAGCCMTIGPDEHIYAIRQQGLHRFHGVTGEFIDIFIPPGHGGLALPLIPYFGPDGNLYLGDRGTHSVRRYDGRTGAPIGDGEFVKGHEQGMGEGDPQFFVHGPDGNLYVASTATHRILRYDGTTGGFIDEFVSAGEGGIAAPSGVVFGPDGHLYVGSTTTDRVIRYHGVTGEHIDDFVPAGSGGLDVPVGLTFGPDGNFYVASAGSPAVGSVLRYGGRTGEFIDAFVPPGGGATGPRTIEFKSTITLCHRPPGSPATARTIRIGYLSSFDHVQHGDAVGACP